MWLIKFAILGIILCGYIMFLVNRHKVNIFFAPVIVIAGIDMFMYISGLLNFMPLACIALSVCGVYFFVRNIRSFDFRIIVEYKLPFLFCLITIAYALYYFTGGIYADGDTLTHWAIIVRQMFRDNCLPSFMSPEVMYSSYPPATACWIYYVLKIVGYTESNALLAQFIWMLACSITVFALTKGKISNYILAAGFCVWVLWIDKLDHLRVDIILPLVVCAAITIILEYGDELLLHKKWLIPFFVVIPVIKNSGILFALFLIPFVAYCVGKDEKNKKENRRMIFEYIGISLASFYLWQTHIKMVFSNAGNSRHSMDLSAMMEIAKGRGDGEFSKIINDFFEAWFTWDWSYEWLVFIALVIVLLLVTTKKNRKENITIVGILLLEYLIYKVMLLGMYLFNMPGNYNGVPSYNRYQLTFSIIVLFCAVYLYLSNSDKFTVTRRYGIVILAMVLLFSIAKIDAKKPDYREDGLYRKLVAIIEQEEDIYPGQKALIYTDYYLSYFFSKFAFDNPSAGAVIEPTLIESALQGNSDGYECIVILVHDDKIKNTLKKYGYDENTKYILLSSEQ